MKRRKIFEIRMPYVPKKLGMHVSHIYLIEKQLKLWASSKNKKVVIYEFGWNKEMFSKSACLKYEFRKQLAFELLNHWNYGILVKKCIGKIGWNGGKKSHSLSLPPSLCLSFFLFFFLSLSLWHFEKNQVDSFSHTIH